MTCGVQLPPALQIKAAFTINYICNMSAVGSQPKRSRNSSIQVATGTAAFTKHPDPSAERRRVHGLSLSPGGKTGVGEEVVQLPKSISPLQRSTWKGGGKGLKQLVSTGGFLRSVPEEQPLAPCRFRGCEQFPSLRRISGEIPSERDKSPFIVVVLLYFFLLLRRRYICFCPPSASSSGPEERAGASSGEGNTRAQPGPGVRGQGWAGNCAAGPPGSLPHL